MESLRSGVTTLVDFMYLHTEPGMTDAVVVGVAPCMIWTVDELALRLTPWLAEERALVTTHVAETTFEIAEAAALYGQIDTEFLSDIASRP